MKEVQDRVVQFSNRYKLTDVDTGTELGTYDFDEVTGTVQQVGTEIDAELFQSIADDLAARVVSNGGELAGTIVTFSDISGTAANVASGDTSATLWGKVKNWFSRLKALAFKDKISNTDVADDAAIAQSKVSGLTNALAGKQPTITGGAASITDDNLTANRAVISDANGKVAVSPVTATELGYLDGVTSNVQTQFNNISNGNTIVGKAIADKNGNDIFNTYATKTEATAAAKNIFRISQDLTNATIGATTQVTVITVGTGANAKANDYVYDEWGNFARLVSKVGSGNWNAIPFAKASASYTTSNPPPYPVTSVAGKTGAVSLSKSDVGLENVDNTSDEDKPISTAMQTALNGKANTSGTYPNLTVGKAVSDGNGNNIVNTYATKANANSVSMVPYGGQATTLSSLESGGVYSISANGYLRIAYQTTAADNFISMKQVDSEGADIWGALANGQKSYGSGYPFIYMPVAKGDHIKVDFSSSVKIIQVQLIKVKTV